MALRRKVKRRGQVAYGAVLVTALFLKEIPLGIAQTETLQKKESQEDFSGKEEALRQELSAIQKELLLFPRKDRFRFGGDFDLSYDTNANRSPVHHEEGDTTFRINPFTEVDLSGQKTDLRFEYRWGRTYQVKRSRVPGNDTFTQEGRLRFGRKILPRTLLSLDDRLSREAVRSAGIDDGKKIRWDQSHRTTLNYELSRKFSMNLEGTHTRSDFTHENFDQDSKLEWILDPSLFFQLTPKSRLALNYRRNYPRIRTKTTDNTKHEFRLGYFGKMTGKSSLSADVALSRQTPDAAEAERIYQIVWSLGSIWQATPKTSLRLLYSTSASNTLVDSLSTTGPPFTKKETISVSDAFSLSMRWRFHRKITTEFSFDGAHARTKSDVKEGTPEVTKSRRWTFPFQWAVDYDLTRGVRLRFIYTFRYRLGDERKADEFRSHTFFMVANLSL